MKKKKFYLLLLIALLAVVLVFLFIYVMPSPKSKESRIIISRNQTPIETYSVDIYLWNFTPSILYINASSKVKWINREGTHQLVCIDSRGNPLDFAVIMNNPNETFEWVFARSGKFICFDNTVGPKINLTIFVH